MERLPGESAYNPVREHISIGFKRVKDAAQQLDTIVRDLLDQGFNPATSRVLVFVRSRRRAEEAAAELTTRLASNHVAWATQVDFFHAGLDSTDREQKYTAFKQSAVVPVDAAAASSLASTPDADEPDPADLVDLDGATTRTVILVATKAFGMGMDIPNIHFVYHLGPSSTFEDFLQEIGRAGRNRKQLEAAGFSEANPIRTQCVMTADEFRELRDLQHQSTLSWAFIQQTQAAIHQYIARFRPLQPSAESFALPLDLLQADTTNDADAGTRFRLALHWLEKLDRIRLGMYTPAFLPLELLPEPRWQLIADEAARDQARQLLAFLRSPRFGGATALTVPLDELRAGAGLRTNTALFKLLFQAQKAQALTIERAIQLEVAGTRAKELKAWQEGGCRAELPMLTAVFSLARQLLAPCRPLDQLRVTSRQLNELATETSYSCFAPEKLFWQEIKEGQTLVGAALSRYLAADWRAKRVKFAFYLLRMLPNVRVRDSFEIRPRARARVTQLLYNGNASAALWQQPLSQLHDHVVALIRLVTEAGSHSFNFVDLALKLGVEARGPDYLDNVLFVAKALGYVKGGGSFVPMGIELFLDNLAVPTRDDPASLDYAIHQEFVEAMQLKELRLLALECLSGLSAPQQDGFIKQYFSCNGSAGLVGLLTEHLGDAHDQLKAFHQEALVQAEAALSPEQRRVYDAPLSQHLQVVAGPGSGKTHTLTLRVARLIQKEKIRPDQILVLAYNRAVVVELKDRLGSLFRKLGYGRLVQRLHVHTFHSLAKRCLGAELLGQDYDAWVPALIQALEKNPSFVRQQLGPIEYVFVDEFQDITTQRLTLLQYLAPPARARMCVIGDPNQSIYGYQRVDEGGAISPKSYYDQFQGIYHPKVLIMSNNYRSYPAILSTAEALLAANPSFNLPPLIAVRTPVSTTEYCHVFNFTEHRIHWKDKLREMLQEEYEPGKRYQQVAVMLRSNDEVFRYFNELQGVPGLLPSDVSVRVQGTSASPYTSREFHHLLQPFRERPTDPLSPNLLIEFAQAKEATLAQFTAWDPYLVRLTHCILLEFQVEQTPDATNQDLLDFFEDLARKDDGHFAKLYQKHIATVAPDQKTRCEVVLTTMHKVKGLEFDAVLIPPSFTDLPITRLRGGEDLAATLEEERRLLYVAYTRARYRLVVIRWRREEAIDNGRSFTLENKATTLGRTVKPGIDKLVISWGARQLNDNAFNAIRDQVKVGDSVTLYRQFDTWQLWCNGVQVGQLRKGAFEVEPLVTTITGLTVSGVSCYTLTDSEKYDSSHGTTYTEKYWDAAARTRGYVYLVDFGGYYKR